MTVKELEAAFTAAAETSMQKAEALPCAPSAKSTAPPPA